MNGVRVLEPYLNNTNKMNAQDILSRRPKAIQFSFTIYYFYKVRILFCKKCMKKKRTNNYKYTGGL